MRTWPNIDRLIRLPHRTPRHEWMHETQSYTGGARCCTGRMVLYAHGEAEAARKESQDGGCARGVYARMVGATRGREAVEAEGDGQERGEDTASHTREQKEIKVGD